MKIFEWLMWGILFLPRLIFRVLGLDILIGKLILSSQIVITPRRSALFEKLCVSDLTISQETITRDGARLRVYKILPTKDKLIPHKTIDACIYFLPSGACAEEYLPLLTQLASDMNTTVYVANPRSVGSSKALNLETDKIYTHSLDDAIDDAEAVYRHVLSEGISSERVRLIGYSLGGAVALGLARRLRDQTSDKARLPYLTTERTFSSLTNVIFASIIGSTPGRPYGYFDLRPTLFKLGFLNWTLGLVARIITAAVVIPIAIVVAVFVKILLTLANWESYSDYHFTNYPREKRSDIVFYPWRAQRDKKTFLGDRVISPWAQLSNAWFVKLSRLFYRIKLRLFKNKKESYEKEKTRQKMNKFSCSLAYANTVDGHTDWGARNRMGLTFFEYHALCVKALNGEPVSYTMLDKPIFTKAAFTGPEPNNAHPGLIKILYHERTRKWYFSVYINEERGRERFAFPNSFIRLTPDKFIQSQEKRQLMDDIKRCLNIDDVITLDPDLFYPPAIYTRAT